MVHWRCHRIFIHLCPGYSVSQLCNDKVTASNSFFGLAIGMMAAAAGWSATSISGGVLNPALGTALVLVHGHYSGFWWIYWAGPILGGVIASGIFRLTADPSEFEEE